MLPCIDEPNRKAIFKFTIETQLKYQVIFCTPEISLTYIDDKTMRVEFMETPILSTYLLGLIIGEFDYVQTHTSRGTKIRVFTPLKKAKLGLFALNAAKVSLELMEDLFK